MVIGNEAVWNRLSGPQDLQPRLLGMDLLRYLRYTVFSIWDGVCGIIPDNFFRLGLERSHSAEEAMTVITSLLETHGQVAAGTLPCIVFVFVFQIYLLYLYIVFVYCLFIYICMLLETHGQVAAGPPPSILLEFQSFNGAKLWQMIFDPV